MIRKSLLTLLMLIVFSVSAFASQITIFHTNDIHARILSTDDNNQSIGLAEMAGAVKNFKSQGHMTLWLDAGDIFHGMPLAATDFQFFGGDGYDMLIGLPVIGEFDACEDAFTDYIVEHGIKDIDTGRIHLLNEVERETA